MTLSKKIYFSLVLVTVLIMGLASCNSVEKTATDQHGNSTLIFSDRQGKFLVLNPEKGKPLLPCKKRENKDVTNKDISPCKTRVITKKNGEPFLVDRETGERIKFQHLTTVYHITFPGSHCETYIVNGKEYEICKEWKKHW